MSSGIRMAKGSEDEVVSLEDVYIPYTFLEELLEEVEREDNNKGGETEGQRVKGSLTFIDVDSHPQVLSEVQAKAKLKGIEEEVELLPKKITTYGDPSEPRATIDWSMVSKDERRRDPNCPWSALDIPESVDMTRRYEEPPLWGKRRSDGKYGLIKKYRPGQ